MYIPPLKGCSFHMSHFPDFSLLFPKG